MKHLLLVYHTQSGNTRSLCEALARGAQAFADQVELRVKTAAQADLADLLWAQGLLIATPENFGYLSGMIKDFFDRTYYPAEGKTLGLPWAMVVSAGNDGTGAVRAAQRIAIGYGWRQVAEPLVVKGIPNPQSWEQCVELGQTLAGGLALGLY